MQARFNTFLHQIRRHLLILLITDNLIIIAGWWIGERFYKVHQVWLLLALSGTALIISLIVAYVSSYVITQPMYILMQAILHVAPDEIGVAAPNPSSLNIGRDLVTNLITDTYKLASVVESVSHVKGDNVLAVSHEFIAKALPVPLLILDKSMNIVFINSAAKHYFALETNELKNKSFYDIFDLSFSSNETFDKWIDTETANSATSHRTWHQVKMTLSNGSIIQFDMAAFYNKDNPQKAEFLITAFDRTREYEADDQSINFISIAVHELRTPLTMLRGYIEVFDEELNGKLTPELADFMRKMKASSEQLSAFVNNILNVARIDGDELVLKLHEESWPEIVKAAVENMQLRAKVHGMEIETFIDEGLPKVGVDRVSITEVINNLLDNAIKYSPHSKKIIVKSYLTKDGLVETTVQDFGIGIPTNVVSNLFSKHYRSFRSKGAVTGTGLGLYLSKAIVSGHNGHIWVRTVENEGSLFGFTLLPYTRLADEQKKLDNKEIVSSAHGWIKNHSLYRR